MSHTRTIPNRPAFTLMELLVVVAVISVLVGAVFPAIRMVRASGSLARELSTARQLMVGYRSYAYEHRGVLLPGYLHELPATTGSGETLNDPVAARYPWRIAPYLDHDLKGLLVDEQLLSHLNSNPQFGDYLLSLFPSFGLNSTFVGGDEQRNGFNDTVKQHLGKFYSSRISEVKHPTELLVFATARINGQNASYAYPGATMVEGYFRLEPPAFTDRDWVANYDPDCGSPCATDHFGNVSLRHKSREAAVGFFDGHTGTLDESGIQDMRHWSDQANRPDWVIQP